MGDIYEVVKEPQWWITVVIAGIAINLLSSYLKNVLDTRLSKMSRWWQSRSLSKAQERKEYVAKLASDDNLFALNSIRLIASIKYTILWTLLAIGALLASQAMRREELSIVMMFFGSLAFYRSFLYLFESHYYESCAEDSVEGDT